MQYQGAAYFVAYTQVGIARNLMWVLFEMLRMLKFQEVSVDTDQKSQWDAHVPENASPVFSSLY